MMLARPVPVVTPRDARAVRPGPLVVIYHPPVDTHFPDAAWITMNRKTLDDLIRFMTRHAPPTKDATVTKLLTRAGRDEP